MDISIPLELSLEEVADQIAIACDADVLLYNGRLDAVASHRLTQEVKRRNRRKNVLLILVTNGGEGGAAYRIARLLQSHYETFTIFATGYCKSAGTLLATGAHELIMSDHAELGPIDVQISKRDELWEMESSLTIMDTLTTLQQKALSACEAFFLALSAKSGGSITLRTATDIATAMTTGLFTPMYSQINPLHLGEAGRAMRIAESYGESLLAGGGNIGLEGLYRMLQGYPSHDYVIDRQEAERLFLRVREPSDEESALAELLGDEAIFANFDPDIPSRLLFRFLSSETSDDSSEMSDDATITRSDLGGSHNVSKIRDGSAQSKVDETLGEKGDYAGENGGGTAFASAAEDEEVSIAGSE